MSAISRRDVIGFLSAAVVSVAMGQHIAGAAEEKPLTPEVIVAKKFEGKATIEFQVGSEGTGAMLGGGTEYGGVAGIHLCPDQPEKGGRIRVWVLMKPAHDLFRLGIDPVDPGGHFRGRVVRVKGEITRRSDSAGAVYELKVESLDQFEGIRKDGAVVGSPKAGVKVEVTGRLVYLKSLRQAPEGLYRVEVGDSCIYLTFADSAKRADAHKRVGEMVTVKGTLTLGVLEKRGATQPEGDAVVAAAEIVTAK
jgi:hypothetical protein